MNVIQTVTKYLPILDEQYHVMSKSAILDTPAEFVQMTKEAKKFKLARITTDGLADYSRAGGFVDGDTDLVWDEYTFSIDRGRSLQIDSMDNVETLGLAFGRLAGTFQKDHVIPEMDAIRFSKYGKGAGIKRSVALTVNNVFSIVDDLVEEQDEAGCPEGAKVIFANPHTYKLMTNEVNINRYLSVDDGLSKALNKKIYSYNEMPIIKVQSNRFYSDITLLDGKTEGQEKGGYVCKAGECVMGMLIVSMAAVIQVSKRSIARFWAPNKAEADANGADGVNPKADAWKFDYRCYHDAWILENKKAGIACVIDLPTITIDSTLSLVAGAKEQLEPVITGPKQAVSFESSDETAAKVSATGEVEAIGAGSANITIKVGSVSKVVAVTVTAAPSV